MIRHRRCNVAEGRTLAGHDLSELRLDGGYAMFVKLAQFLEIMLYMLAAGVMWGTWLSLGRTMTRYDAATFLCGRSSERCPFQ